MNRRRFLTSLGAAAAALTLGLKAPEPRLRIVGTEYLTDRNAWFLQNDIVVRYSMGVSDWRGLWGTTK